MSTLVTLHPKIILKEMRTLQTHMILIMLMYSLKSPFEQDKNFREDQNLFLSDFLMDASVDYESNISIRSTVIDFFDELF